MSVSEVAKLADSTLVYPTKPKKPQLGFSHTSEQARDYAKDLRDYEHLRAAYDEAVVDYHYAMKEIEKQFKLDLEKEYSLTGHPKADKVFDMAWEDGHSSGYGSVESYYERYADLVL